MTVRSNNHTLASSNTNSLDEAFPFKVYDYNAVVSLIYATLNNTHKNFDKSANISYVSYELAAMAFQKDAALAKEFLFPVVDSKWSYKWHSAKARLKQFEVAQAFLQICFKKLSAGITSDCKKRVARTLTQTTEQVVNRDAILKYRNSLGRQDKLLEVDLFLLNVDENNLVKNSLRLTKCGRRVENKFGLQRASRRLREVALTGTGAVDLDQKRACPTIAGNLLAMNGYVDAAFALELIMNSDCSKGLKLKTTFGGGQAEYSNKPHFPLVLHNETKESSLPYLTYHTNTVATATYWHGVKTYMTSLGHVWASEKELRHLWAYEVFTIEGQMQHRVEDLLAEAGFNIGAHIFDGCIVSTCPSEALIEKINETIRLEYDIPAFNLVIKRTF